MKIKAIRIVLLIVLFLIISVQAISEKLSDNMYLKNNVIKKDNFLDRWHIETVDSFGDVGQYTDITINDDNQVFISYYDFGKKDLKVACLTNSRWNITIVDSEGDVGKCASLALDNFGNPHIIYYDETLHALKHAYLNENKWYTEVVDNSGNVGLDNSIAIDSTNHIHISYHDENNGYLKYAKLIDNDWYIEVVDSIGDTGEISSITLDNNNDPHISYTNRYDFHLYHAYYSHDNWVKEKVDDKSVLYGSTYITYDLDYFIHILYYDVTPDHFSLKHAYQSNDGWHIEIIDPYLWGTFGTGGANIGFDEQGIIHIGYFNWAWQTINYAWKSINNIWNLELVDSPEFGVYVGAYTALAVDQNGTPHVSYMDMNNNDLKYARKLEYNPGIPTSPSGNPKGKTGETYIFTTKSEDLDNDKIQYGWDLNGDLQVDQWTDLINSNETCEFSYKWDEPGSYIIRVISKDEKGLMNGYHLNEDGEFSEWSDSLSVKISKSKLSGNEIFPGLFIRFKETFIEIIK